MSATCTPFPILPPATCGRLIRPRGSERLGRGEAGVTGRETKSSLERSVFVFVYVITRGGGGGGRGGGES